MGKSMGNFVKYSMHFLNNLLMFFGGIPNKIYERMNAKCQISLWDIFGKTVEEFSVFLYVNPNFLNCPETMKTYIKFIYIFVLPEYNQDILMYFLEKYNSLYLK